MTRGPGIRRLTRNASTRWRHMLVALLVLLCSSGCDDAGHRGAVAGAAQGHAGRAVPGGRVGFDPLLGRRVAIDHAVLTTADARVALGDLLGAVTVVVPVYYRCPNLCDLTLAGVAELLADAAAGPTLDVVILGFAVDERAADARAIAAMLADRHPALPFDAHWHFVRATPESVEPITASLGFRFEKDTETGLYSHAAGLVVVDRDGTIRGFLDGIRFDGAALDGLLSDPAVTAPAMTPPGADAAPSRVILWCFDYDPETGRYTLAIMRVLRFAGIATVLAIALGVLISARGRRP